MLNLIIKDYKQLNNVVKSVVDSSSIEWSQQIFIVDFYDKYSTIDKIEELRSLNTNSIYTLLNYITSCQQNLNCESLNKIDLKNCLKLELNQTEIVMKNTHSSCKKIDAKVLEIKESIKELKIKGDEKYKEQMYNRLYNHYISELNRENNNMYQLIDKIRAMESNIELYNKNIFNKLQKLNLSYLHILQGFI